MRYGFLVSLALFGIACSLPALEFKTTKGPNDILWGLNILMVGWSGIFAAVVAWYANPFWLLGILLGLFRKPLLAGVAGLVAMAIASTTFAVIGRELPADEGNVTKMTLIRLLPGCYLWMASLVALPLAAVLQKLR